VDPGRRETEMSRRKIVSVVGTRPNFMKIAPVIRELAVHPNDFEHVLVHTGQHYDDLMSRVFIEELGVGTPNTFLNVGSGSHGQQVARVIERLEPVLLEESPDLVLVAGDVNSTLGAALAAAKLPVPVGHVEAGLRSFDRTMPEEINRIVADSVSEFLFTHSPEARDNLLREGRPESAIHYVGNTMVDTLMAMRERIKNLRAPELHELERATYVVVTLHRPRLVDGGLLPVALSALSDLSDEYVIVFPAHPRTRAAMQALGLDPASERLRILEPLGYLEFVGLLSDAAAAVTDSGGIQEEATFLGVPCFTLRENTERPVTVELGTNVLLGLAPERIRELPRLIANVATQPLKVPPLWDGKAAERIVDILDKRLVHRSGQHAALTGRAAPEGASPRQ
jgi:UDP-N-acetylglucosamine 2-epimerase (non-hydrolysing)